MTEQKTLPPRSGIDFTNPSPAFDPVVQPQLFDGVIGKRSSPSSSTPSSSHCCGFAVFVVAVLGVLTLGLAWLLFGMVFPVVGLGYNALTIGGPNSATIGQRLMGLEGRMWFGGKVSPLVAAFHALLFWFSLVVFCPILLWACSTRASVACTTFSRAWWSSTGPSRESILKFRGCSVRISALVPDCTVAPSIH